MPRGSSETLKSEVPGGPLGGENCVIIPSVSRKRGRFSYRRVQFSAATAVGDAVATENRFALFTLSLRWQAFPTTEPITAWGYRIFTTSAWVAFFPERRPHPGPVRAERE
jgi:hypothetical protein